MRMWRAPPGVSSSSMLRAPAALTSCARGVRRAVGRSGSCSRARAPRSPLVQGQVIQLPLSVVYKHLSAEKEIAVQQREWLGAQGLAKSGYRSRPPRAVKEGFMMCCKLRHWPEQAGLLR